MQHHLFIPQDTPRIVGHCAACKIPMISEWKWRQIDPARRDPKVMSYHKAHGHCSKCWSRVEHHGHAGLLPKQRGPQRPEDVKVTHCKDCNVGMVFQMHRQRWPEVAEKYKATGGQGYCRSCYRKHEIAGDLVRIKRRADDTLEDWVFLRDDGVSLEEAAKRMDMKLTTLQQQLYRARRKGDPRGSLVPFAHDMRRAA